MESFILGSNGIIFLFDFFYNIPKWNETTQNKNKIAFRSLNETFHMWGQDHEQFWWLFQNFKKVAFLKIQFQNILNDIEI
jgi:hypothetical protein